VRPLHAEANVEQRLIRKAHRRVARATKGLSRLGFGAPGGTRTPDPRLRSPSVLAVFSVSYGTEGTLEDTNRLEGSAPPTTPISSASGARTGKPARPDYRPGSPAPDGRPRPAVVAMPAGSHQAVLASSAPRRQRAGSAECHTTLANPGLIVYTVTYVKLRRREVCEPAPGSTGSNPRRDSQACGTRNSKGLSRSPDHSNAPWARLGMMTPRESNPCFSLERLSFESSDLPRPVTKHGIQDREELPHRGDDRHLAGTARGHEAVKERPYHWIVLDRRDRGRRLPPRFRITRASCPRSTWHPFEVISNRITGGRRVAVEIHGHLDACCPASTAATAST
jgi:hypothetical protein